MKLERLEELKKVNTKNLIVGQVLGTLDEKRFYNKFELEVSLILAFATIFGNTEVHKAMNSEDINWIEFVEQIQDLVVEIKNGEYSNDYNEVYEEICRGAHAMEKYNSSIVGFMESFMSNFTEENMKKINEMISDVSK